MQKMYLLAKRVFIHGIISYNDLCRELNSLQKYLVITHIYKLEKNARMSPMGFRSYYIYSSIYSRQGRYIGRDRSSAVFSYSVNTAGLRGRFFGCLC